MKLREITMSIEPKKAKAARNVNVSMERLYDVMMSVAATGTRDQFIKLCKDQDLTVTAHPDTVAAVKEHLTGAVLPADGTAADSDSEFGRTRHRRCFPELKVTRLA